MKTPKSSLRAVFVLTLAMVAVASASAADLLKYKAKPGGKMRIDGTSTLHDWNAESRFVSGRLELDPAFPVDPTVKDLKAGKLEASANVTILVRTFKCSSGSAMDTIMQETMDAQNYPKIEYKLTELVFKEVKDDALVFDSKGDLTLHGNTKTVSFPVEILRPDKSTLRIKGTTDLKMTEFGMKPPAPLGGTIKTGDDVKITFEWVLAQLPAGG